MGEKFSKVMQIKKKEKKKGGGGGKKTKNISRNVRNEALHKSNKKQYEQ
jgi:hypothetical protein